MSTKLSRFIHRHDPRTRHKKFIVFCNFFIPIATLVAFKLLLIVDSLDGSPTLEGTKLNIAWGIAITLPLLFVSITTSSWNTNPDFYKRRLQKKREERTTVLTKFRPKK